MSEENQPNNTAAAAQDAAKAGPNSPAEKAETNWEMPAPIFRVSEGVTVSTKPSEPLPEKEGQIVHEALPDTPPDTKPQADASEQVAPGEIVLEPVPAKKPSFSILGVLMTAVGIFGMIVFLIVLLGLIYFYFFYKSEPGSVF